jgi:hypothetical protein
MFAQLHRSDIAEYHDGADDERNHHQHDDCHG